MAAAPRRRLPWVPWHRYRSVAATRMPPWMVVQTARLVPSVTVPTIWDQGPIWAMMVTGMRASEFNGVDGLRTYIRCTHSEFS